MGHDPVAEAGLNLACGLFTVFRQEALRGNMDDRLFLMGPEGMAFMIELGLDPDAVRAVLVDEWCQAGLRCLARRRVVLSRKVLENANNLHYA